jgi:hypothetical protein
MALLAASAALTGGGGGDDERAGSAPRTPSVGRFLCTLARNLAARWVR